MIEIIEKYFPTLSERQKEQYAALGTLYPEWNAKINVISRKDIDNLYEHHILHSLGIAKALRFTDGTTLVDVGTGHTVGHYVPQLPVSPHRPHRQEGACSYRDSQCHRP